MSSLKLTLFGAPQVELNGKRIALKTRKAFALLAYLAVSRQPQSRETLATLFWPDFPAERAFANLRDALQTLTHALGDDWFAICRRDIAINSSSALFVDVQEFQRLLNHPNNHYALTISVEERLPSLQAAVKLYQDDFLRGFTLPDCLAFDEWQTAHTDQLRQQMVETLRQLIGHYTAQRDMAAAIQYAQRCVEVCPWEEDAHREMMRVYAAAHQREAALQQYQECAHILREEFEAEPEPETQALYRDLLNCQPSNNNTHNDTHTHAEIAAPVFPPNNLPAQTTTFIGREAEVAAVIGLLSRKAVRFVTLTGPGGSGKTRLSLQAAERMMRQFADGVFFVSLAPIANPDFVAPIIAQVLGLQITGSIPPLEALATYLHQKRLLLVLDNLEQFLDAASILHALLAAAPGLKILATSRAVLRLSGEHAYLVPPLRLPDPAHLPSFESVTRFEAIRLFVERAQAAAMNFRLTDENALIVAQICARLDGLPLAIELAAARARLLSPKAMLAYLECPLRFLSIGERDRPIRQQTLRNTITWSFHLLSIEEQTVFRRLAVFVGGWSIEAAEAVCRFNDDVDVFDGLQALADHHLITHAESCGTPRFAMLETIREYALERLKESGEEEIVRRQHARYFLALLEKGEPYWDTHEQVKWLACLDADSNNFRADLTWSLHHDREIALRLAGALGIFWDKRTYDQESRDWLTKVLADEESMALYRQIGNAKELSNALWKYGWLLSMEQDADGARKYAEECLALGQETGNLDAVACGNMLLGQIAMLQEEYATAQELYEHTLTLARQLENSRMISYALSILGTLFDMQGRYEQARAAYVEALTIIQKWDNAFAAAWQFNGLGRVALHQQQWSTARAYFSDSLQAFQRQADQIGIAACLIGFAGIADGKGHQERAVLLLGAIEHLRPKIVSLIYKEDLAVQREYDRIEAAIRSALGADAFAAAFAKGRDMTLEQAIALATGGQ
ncbi:Glr1376 protein [Candidatus Moduliflexus flocculans]|uniref:Glr1376 protein n=1 Tax=Candidatus Moduliflexus flocculans TaxID=1499966 RepID=A0A0S6W4V1_9BACT|nr:Glr1376 protein [Candidatus Moduliflexus flocculans]